VLLVCVVVLPANWEHARLVPLTHVTSTTCHQWHSDNLHHDDTTHWRMTQWQLAKITRGAGGYFHTVILTSHNEKTPNEKTLNKKTPKNAKW